MLQKIRNSPFFSKNTECAIAHGFEHGGFWQSWKSLHTTWNVPQILENWFLTRCGTICVDFGWICKGPKFAVFTAKTMYIARGFESGGFWKVLEIAPNSLKRRLKASKWISNTLRDCLCLFRVNTQGSQIRRFQKKTLCNSPWFWTWRILASSGNRSKLPETSTKCLKMDL